jgi:Family of unknown function (DUF5719)
MIARAAALCLAFATGTGAVALAARLPDAALTSGVVVGTSGQPTAGAGRLTIPAGTATLACPGPETSVVPDGGRRTPVPGAFSLTAAAAGPDAAHAGLTRLAGDARVAAFSGSGSHLRVLTRDGDPHVPVRLRAAPSGADPTGLSAVQTTLSRAGDRRALLAGSCGGDTSDAWLVGGGSAAGRRGRLLLANPTPAAALVDVLVAGPSGAIDAPAGRGLVVAPGRVRAVQVDALAPGLVRLAVHVVARRGRVAVLLHDSYLRGATPAGADDVPAAAAPSRQLVVPGIVVRAAPAGGTASATVRLVAPGRNAAVVHLHLTGPAGDVQLPGAGVVTVPAGGVVDVPLTGIAPGAYAALADADVPIVAGAAVAAAAPPSGPLRTATADFGWATATAPLRGRVVAALPRPADVSGRTVARAPAVLQLALTSGTRDADVAIRQVGADGRQVRQAIVHVPPARTVAVVLAPAAVALELTVPEGRPVWGGITVQVADPAGPLLALVSLVPPVAAAQDAPVAVADPWLTGPPLPTQSSPTQSSSLP